MPSPLRSVAACVAACIAAASPLGAQSSHGLRLDLNIPTLRLVVYDGDKVLHRYPVAVGESGFPTPTGQFQVSSAEWNPWWRPPAREWAKDDKITPPGPDNPMGRVKLFFTNLYYLHGTPDEKSIGSAASHGCVRMLNKDVIALGTLIQLRTGTNKGPNFVKSVLAGRKTARVGFPETVPLTIRYEPIVVENGMIRFYPDLYNRRNVHSEGVYQALLAAGYRVDALPRAEVHALLERARKQKGTFSLAVADAFGDIAIPAADAGASTGQR